MQGNKYIEPIKLFDHEIPDQAGETRKGHILTPAHRCNEVGALEDFPEFSRTQCMIPSSHRLSWSNLGYWAILCHGKPRWNMANLIFAWIPSNKQQSREQFTIANYDVVSYIKVYFQHQLSQLQSRNLTKSFRNLVSTMFGLERNTH